MRRRVRDAIGLLAVGYRVDAKLTTELLASTVAYHLTQTLRALWLKLLVDIILRHNVDGAMASAAVLAANDVLRTVAIVRVQMAKRDLQDKAVQYFEEESMRLSGGLPGIAHTERQAYLDRLQEFRTAMPTLSGGLGSVSDGLTMAVRIVFILVLLIGVHPVLALLPLFALPSLVTGRLAQKAVHDGQRAVAAPTRLGEHFSTVISQPGPAKETLVGGLGPELRRRYLEAAQEAAGRDLAASVRSNLLNFAGWAVYAVGYIGSLLFVVWTAADGRATPGDVFLVAILAAQVNTVVQEAVTLVGLLTTVFHAIDLRIWLLAGDDSQATMGTAPAPEALREGITIDAATFRYPDTDVDVLEDISVHIPAGATVAVVGENGAGKSTLVKLLCGLYQPQEGRITVEGVDLATIDPASWRCRLTASFQDFVRFELTVNDAVGIGDLAADNDPTAVGRALAAAEATKLVGGLPQGLETQLGPTFGGVDLSAGQWQRLAVARAFMRPHPLVLLLDEPSSALDPTAEAALLDHYARAGRDASANTGGITVLVSHRFASVRRADLILVLDAGRLVDAGNHHELMARGSVYAELYELQAAAYR